MRSLCLNGIGKRSDYVFTDDRGGRLPSWALDQMLRRMDCADSTTAHGLRATFRTWAAECTSYPREIIEQCLAHRVGDAVSRLIKDLISLRNGAG